MSATGRITGSLRLYGLLLQLYPASFYLEWRGEMLQLFRDLARDACRDHGTWGLVRLWVRAGVDLAVCLPVAYYRTGRSVMRKLVAGWGVLYLIVLLGGVGVGAVGFREFYERPAFHVAAVPEASEDQLLGAYEEALRGPYGTYKMFAAVLGFGVAVCLGLSTALFGLWQKSAWRGAGAFAVGTFATLLALSALPWIYFPFDRYPVAALWIMGGPSLVAAACWVAVTLSGRLLLPGPLRMAGTT